MRGERLRQLRESSGLTQEELAERANVAIRQIARYEANQTDPSSEVMSRLADVLGASTDYLLGRTDETTSYIQVTNLTANEKRALMLWRKGLKYEAIEVIVEDKATV